MSRELLILRHAEAESKVTDKVDYDRELTAKGLAQCVSVGQQLANEKIQPDFVISSAAVRARDTCERVLLHALLAPLMQFDRELYEIEDLPLLDYIRHLDDKYMRIMLTGHNPVLSNLLFRLTRTDSGMSTCDLAIITCTTETWKEFGPHNTRLVKILHA